MTTKKKIRIYYRAPSHVPLWKVMEEGGFLEKHGLEMDFGSLEGQRKRAAEGLKSGELDIVSGNHHNLYARKALSDDPYVHIAQSNNAKIISSWVRASTAFKISKESSWRWTITTATRD